MLLNVAVKQRQPGLIGHHVDRDASVAGNDNGIFHHSRRSFAIDLDYFKRVPVHVQRMIVLTAIAKHQAVTAALLQDKFLIVRIFLSVHGPTVE